MRRELLYPSILSCSETLTNPYWQRLLTELAYGNCPVGTYISNGALISTAFAWKIPDDDLDEYEQVTDDLIQLIQDNLGLFSEEDTAERQEHFYQILASKNPDSTPDSWQELKKVFGKDIPIAHFVVNLLKDSSGNIDNEKANRTMANINLALGLKTIGNNDIVIENTRIVAIPALSLEL